MKFGKLILILSLSLFVIFGLMLGISYGWYQYENAESNVDATTIEEIPNVYFDQTEFVKNTVNYPIKDDDIYKFGQANSFDITLSNKLVDYQVGYEISLEDIVIDDELKINSYKYLLLEDDKVIIKGSFSELNENKLILKPMNMIVENVLPKTYNYKLYIWLSDDDTNQNNLMRKKFSAKITVSSAVKK